MLKSNKVIKDTEKLLHLYWKKYLFLIYQFFQELYFLHEVQSIICKVERQLRVTTFATLNLGLMLEGNWDIKDERLTMRFKWNKYIKREKKWSPSLGKKQKVI